MGIRPIGLMVYLVAISAVLVSCGPRHMVRIAPAATETSVHASLRQRLTASTNCAEIGEEIVFTVDLTNQTNEALRVVDTPPLDIRIRPYFAVAPIERWSDTDQYPRDLDPVFALGEIRTYTWRWVADPVFAGGIWVEMPVDVRTSGSRGELAALPLLKVGIDSHPDIEARSMRCADFTR